jgi:hypothetical protein
MARKETIKKIINSANITEAQRKIALEVLDLLSLKSWELRTLGIEETSSQNGKDSLKDEIFKILQASDKPLTALEVHKLLGRDSISTHKVVGLLCSLKRRRKVIIANNSWDKKHSVLLGKAYNYPSNSVSLYMAKLD